MFQASGGGEILFKGDEQMYGHVLKSLGDKRFKLVCDDGIERIGKCRGKMRRSQWVAVNAYVLACTREFSDDKIDIIHVYSDDHARLLRKYGEFAPFEAIETRDDTNEDLVDFENDDDIDAV
jgi:initiation factor 1A